jgi:hypothetical protein
MLNCLVAEMHVLLYKNSNNKDGENGKKVIINVLPILVTLVGIITDVILLL